MASHITTSSILSRAEKKRFGANTKTPDIVAAATAAAKARVMDPDVPNVDRTPLPLSKPPQPTKSLGKRAAERRPSGQATESRKVTESVSQMESTNSSDRVSSNTPEESTTIGFEESSETRSTDRSTIKHSDMTSVSVQRTGRPADADDNQDLQEERALPIKVEQWDQKDKQRWMGALVHITLTTMPVVTHFTRDDQIINKEKEPSVAKEVEELNAAYATYCEKRVKDEGKSRFTERGSTTLNDPKRSIQCLVQPPTTRHAHAHVAPWKLEDEYKKLNAEDDLDEGQAVEVEAEQVVDGDDGDIKEVNDTEEGDADAEAATSSKPKTKGWMAAESLLETVLIMERAVLQNTFEDLQLAYRGIEMPTLVDYLQQEHPVLASDSRDRKRAANARYGGNEFLDTQGEKREEERRQKEEQQRATEVANAEEAAQNKPSAHRGGQIRELWKFSSPMLDRKHVTCMAWNKANTDLLAAGYGNNVTVDDKQGGTICCWSLKNPVAPERVIKLETDAGISSMSFSEDHPSLLAVGNTDGTLALYDVRVHGNTPALKSAANAGQHTGTIWDVRWVQKGKGRGEGLMTISADGHVMEWSLKKGLERTADLMKLKRIPNQNSDNAGILGGGKNSNPREALLSRQSGGMTFDVSPRDSIIYIVGTEDGTLHKCSKSQNENYILDYRQHEEPVYRLRWNPFSPQYFLTCSADWTSRLYHIDRPEPVLRLDSNNQDSVQDISWSTARCSVLATGTAQGRVQIWDIADPLKEKATYEIKGQSINSVLFAAQESPVVVAGDSRGDVTVLKLIGSEFERNGMSDAHQEQLFNEIVQKVAV